jgi:sugar phosphate permease
MDRRGPLLVVEIGVVLTAFGLGLAAVAREPWQLYATLGILVATGANFLGYGVQSQLIPHWFVRRRGLAIGIAFSGVGIASTALLPWMQLLIARDGWRYACVALALITAVVLIPLNLLLRKRPQDIGLNPDGDAAPAAVRAGPAANVVDAAWAATHWTLARAVRTARFWWIVIGYFGLLYAWYAVQVHQTKYLTEIGVSPVRSRMGARPRQPRGRSRLDHLRPRVGPHRPRMGLGDRLPRLRRLLRAADRHAGGATRCCSTRWC